MAPLPLRPIEFRGHTLQSFAAGDADADTDETPPLIFLHGFFVSLRFIPHALPPQIRDGRRWHAVSLPCHPPAAAPNGLSRGDIDSNWLADLVDHVAGALSPNRPPILLGHSAGAFLALNAAARRPERFAKVVAINGFVNGGLTLTEKLLQLLSHAGPAGKVGFNLSLKAGTLSAGLHERMSGGLAGDADALRSSDRMSAAVAAYLPDLQSLSAAQLDALRIFTAMMPELDCTERLGGLADVPILLINGEEDPIVPAAHVAEMRERLPSAQSHLLPGVGHLPMFEAEDKYDALLTRFLGSGQSGAGGAERDSR